MKRTAAAHVLLASLLWLVGSAGAEAAASSDTEFQSGFCKRPFSRGSLFRSSASMDLYNAALWTGGVAAVEFGTSPKSRWTRRNDFDDELRSGLRGGSASARNDASTASDVMLGLSAGVLPLLSIGKTLSEHDCHEAYDMATDAAESIALTLFVTEATKAIAGRERPYVQGCDGSPPRDASCGSDDRKQSFISGHSSLAGAGAGLTCAYAIKRRTWGDEPASRVAPCVLGVGAALTTGALRIVADKHWGSDVLVGLAVGATVGYFDTWGPFDLLRFEVHSDDLAWDVRGIVMPYAADGLIGARLSLSF